MPAVWIAVSARAPLLCAGFLRTRAEHAMHVRRLRLATVIEFFLARLAI
jgi:hypothetical protein